ncbi:hypothetical protein ACTXT7_001050 [Hymenolepis weldensis]
MTKTCAHSFEITHLANLSKARHISGIDWNCQTIDIAALFRTSPLFLFPVTVVDSPSTIINLLRRFRDLYPEVRQAVCLKCTNSFRIAFWGLIPCPEQYFDDRFSFGQFLLPISNSARDFLGSFNRLFNLLRSPSWFFLLRNS